MKKKNLIVLLLIPFLIALLGVVTINTTIKLVDTDIVDIKWNYNDFEGFKLREELYELKAEPISLGPLSKGNNLIWTLRNKDLNDSNVYGEIVLKNDKYYLKTISDGEVILTCSNEKGNIFRSLTAIIYENGAIIVQPIIKGSQSNIDQTIYYGEYDLMNHQKVNASFGFSLQAIPESVNSRLEVINVTDNIEVDLNKKQVNIKGSGPASFTITCGVETLAKDVTTTFEIVENGVNVYTYEDLLDCTNRSIDGEIVVLRKSFESLTNAYQTNSDGSLMINQGKLVLKANNIECFGNYDLKTNKFSFDQEIYKFTTTYNKEFIDQWNQKMKESGGSNFLSDQVKAGLHIQKDFYGNGYTINMHNLTFPSAVIEADDGTGNLISIPTLGVNDLFRGPLPFYALGDPNSLALVEAYGQDNCGMYLDGDNILVNDLNMRNCDFGNSYANLDTVGTVVEINGNNITIKNSRLANGKNVVRSFSSMNVTIDNSLLSYARNFLILTGSNDYIKINSEETCEFSDGTNQVRFKISDFLIQKGPGDEILNTFIAGSFESKAKMKTSLLSIQNALSNQSKVKNDSGNVIYKGSIKINNTYFYNSGIASIALDSMFNGPYLYSNIPSAINTILSMLSTSDGISLSQLSTSNIGGLSYPVKVEITGKTRFYDYKNTDDFDISGLIKENISSFAASINPDYEGVIDIDKIFPIKKYLMSEAVAQGSIYNSNINVPIAYYGGGLNLSKVDITTAELEMHLNSTIEIDLLDIYLDLDSGEGLVEVLKNMMVKAVSVTIGFEPFKFVCIKEGSDGYLYGETPKVSDLIQNNIKGE